MQIAANTSNFCTLQFDLKIDATQSNDTTPKLVEQQAGFDGPQPCDNGASAAPVSASAFPLAGTCQPALSIAYPTPVDNGVARVDVQLGAGPIDGGTQLTVNGFTFDLDTDAASLFQCGSVVSYVKDSLSSNCTTGPFIGGGFPVGFTVSNSSDGNRAIFTASLPINFGANEFHFCDVSFDIGVHGAPAQTVRPARESALYRSAHDLQAALDAAY